MSSLEQFVLRPSADAVIALAGTSAVIGTEGQIKFGPVMLGTPVALAATAYLTNIGFNIVKDQLKKSQSDKMVDLEVGLAGPLLNAGIMTGVGFAFMIMGPYASNSAMFKVAAVGALSNFAGPRLYEVVGPSLM
jgi:hypothetical protein